MVKLSLLALNSDLTVVYTLTILCICQQQNGIWRRITVDRYFIAYCVSYVYLGSHSCADQQLFLYSPSHPSSSCFSYSYSYSWLTHW